MEERNLSSWEEFEKALKDIRDEHEQSDVQLKSSSLLFRGQENSSWSLTTTLDRKRERMLFKDYYGIITRIRPQIETLTGSEWPIPDYPQVRKDVEDYDKFSMELWCGRCPGYPYLAYLRHHGFPSPLLDWSPLRTLLHISPSTRPKFRQIRLQSTYSLRFLTSLQGTGCQFSTATSTVGQ